MTTDVSAREGLDSYFKNAWKVPILEKEEEQILAIRWRDHADSKAIETLITSHLRLVAKMAMKYRSYGLPMADLISEGNIGLIKSVQKFDPDRGFRLSTYAMWWIKAAIIDYILKSWSMVKVGSVANQKKLFFTLSRAKARLNIIDGMELSPEQALLLSKATNVSADDVVQMNRRLSFRDSSLNAPLSSEANAGELQELLVDERESQEVILGDREEKQQQIKILFGAIDELPERERHIFKTRRLIEDRPTLEQLGDHYGITRERVRQLEAKAFDRVKKIIFTRMHSGDGSKEVFSY